MSKAAKKEDSTPNSFMQFLRDQSVLGVAIGLIIGVASGTFINSFIDNIVMPPIALLMGSVDGISGLVWEVTLRNGNSTTISYGQFLSDFLNFVVIAFVVYQMIRIFKVQARR